MLIKSVLANPVSTSAAAPATTVLLLSHLPWQEVGVALLLSSAGGMVAFVLTVIESDEKSPIPWWAHWVLAMAAGFLAFSWMAGRGFSPWTQAGLLFVAGISGRGVLLAVQSAAAAWVQARAGAKK